MSGIYNINILYGKEDGTCGIKVTMLVNDET